MAVTQHGLGQEPAKDDDDGESEEADGENGEEAEAESVDEDADENADADEASNADADENSERDSEPDENVELRRAGATRAPRQPPPPPHPPRSGVKTDKPPRSGVKTDKTTARSTRAAPAKVFFLTYVTYVGHMLDICCNCVFSDHWRAALASLRTASRTSFLIVVFCRRPRYDHDVPADQDPARH